MLWFIFYCQGNSSALGALTVRCRSKCNGRVRVYGRCSLTVTLIAVLIRPLVTLFLLGVIIVVCPNEAGCFTRLNRYVFTRSQCQ